MRYLAVAAITAILASAATATADHLITGRQIARNTITSANIKNGTITSRDLRRGAITSRSLSARTAQELQATPVASVVSTEEVAQAPAAKTLQARCPAGHVATGGGGDVAENPSNSNLKFSRPLLDEDNVPVGWEARLVFSDPAKPSYTMRVFALCTPSAY